MRQLQGNLLHTLIAPTLPELAGKITGMLLEGLTVEEVGAVLSDARVREERVAEALASARRRRRARARAPLRVNVAAAVGAAVAESPRLRMSPRASTSGYSTAQILGVA